MNRFSTKSVECVVWWASPLSEPDLFGFLDLHERERADRLRRPEDRERYVTAHALVRLLLAERTGLPADALTFDRTCARCGAQHGKPRLTGRTALRFSLTSSASRVGVAITTGAEVGVDVEAVPTVPEVWRSVLAREVLDDAEHTQLEALPDAVRGEALATWWTRKEAVLKATGEGLSRSPRTLRVSSPSSPPEVLSWVPAGSRGARPRVRLDDLSPGGRYVGALAVIGRGPVAVAERNGDPVLAGALADGGARTLSA